MDRRLRPRQGEGDDLGAVLAKRGNDRLEALLAAEDPFALVASMSKAEVFFSYAEVDDEVGRRVVVRLATDEQVDYLLDLDLWTRDEMDEEALVEWLDRLLGAGDERALAWALHAEPELLVSAFARLIDVHEGPAASEMALTEAQDQLPPYTLEGHYYILFRSREAAQPVKRILTLLAGEDLERAMAILAEIVSCTEAEVEELALAQRWSRLADEGLERPESACDIYRWPTKEEVAGALAEPGRAPPPAGDPGPGSPTALAIGEPRGLLAAALAGLPSSREVDRVTASLVATSNLVLSADYLPFAEVEAHGRALAKTLGYVTIGLDRACRGEPALAPEVLSRSDARLLFRMGYREVAELGRRATLLRRKGWLSQVGLGVEVLDTPLGETVKALARPRPLYPACLSGEPSDREFREAAEVARAAEVLERAESLGRLFVDALGLPLAPAAAFDLEGCHPASTAELTLGLILRTAVARLALDGALRFEPVEAHRLAELPALLVERGRIDEALGRRARAELLGRLGGPEGPVAEHVEAFLAESLDILAAAFEGLSPGQPVDPRFVGAIVTRAPS